MDISAIVHTLPRLLRRHKVVKGLLFLSPGSRVQLVRFNETGRLFADMEDPSARHYMLVQGFEPEFFSIAKPFLLKGGVFFDVGANFGFCSFGLMASPADRDVEYHLFEANSDICNLLSKSAKLYSDKVVYINHSCVTDTAGISKLRLDRSNFGSSYISENGTQEVKNLVLDEYIYRKSIKKVNLLKLDIEGWEPRALLGSMESLSSGTVEAVYMEVSSENLRRAGFSVQHCLDLLRESGFSLFYVKASDFRSSLIEMGNILTLNINGQALKASELSSFPAEYQTDILAIHKSSEYLRS